MKPDKAPTQAELPRSNKSFPLRNVAVAMAFFLFAATQTLQAAIYFARTSGNWNNPATWSNAGYGGTAALSTPGSGPGDVVLLSGCQVTVTATPAYPILLLTVSQNYNSGNDTRLLLNTTSVLTCLSVAMIDNNRNDDTEIEVSNGGLLQVNGNVSISRSAANNRDKRVRLYIHDTGRMNVTGNFTYNYGKALPNESQENEIELDNGRLDVNGNMTLSSGNTGGNNNIFEFLLTNNAVCNVGGNVNVSLSNTDDDDNITFNLFSGVFTIAGALNATVASTATAHSSIGFIISGAELNTGDFSYLNYGGNDAFRPQVDLNGSGRLNINGDFNLTHGRSSWNATKLEVEMNDDAQCHVTGNVEVILENTNDGDDFEFDLNGGVFAIDGTLTANVRSSSSGGCNFSVNADGGFLYAGDAVINHFGGSGGDINIYLNRNSTANASLIHIYNDFIYTHTAGDNLNLETYTNSVLNIEGLMSVDIASSADGDGAYLRFFGGQANMGSIRCSVSSGATAANDMFITVDGASVNVAGNLNIYHFGGGGSGDINILLNNFSTAQQSTLSVNGDLILHHTGGDNMEIELNANAGLTVGGSLIDTLQSNDGDDFIIDINGGSLIVGNDFMHVQTGVGSSYEDLDIRIDNNGTMTVNGSVEIDHACGGQIIIYMNTVAGSQAQFIVGEDFFIDHSPAANGMYMQLDQSASMSIGGSFQVDNNAGGGDAFRLRINNNAQFAVLNNISLNLLSGSALNDNVEIDINGGSVTVGNNITLNAVSGRDAILTIDGSAQLTVNGMLNLDHSGGNLMYVYLGNAFGSPVLNLSAVNFNDTGGGQTRFRLWNSSVLNVAGDITMNALAPSQVDLALYNTSTLRIAGNFNRAPSPGKYGILSCATGATVELNGSSLQYIAGSAGDGGDGFAYSNVVLNNSCGISPQFIMTSSEGNANIPSGCNLTFNRGVVSSSSSAFFNIANGATVSSASDLSYVDGPIRKTGMQAFVFPVGDNGSYRPAAISAPVNATHHFTAQYIYADPGNIYNENSKDASLHHISNCEYWYINRTGGASNVVVTLTWDETSCGVDDLTSLRVAQWDGSAWRNRGNAMIAGDTAAGSISTSVSITAFLSPDAPFTLASSTGNNPLPVELLDFSAVAVDNMVKLVWQTASESDNDRFIIQRSADGIEFINIGEMKGKGESHSIASYLYNDNAPLTGISYYRLKQLDFNGNFSCSAVRKVEFMQSNTKATVYPNPLMGNALYIKGIGAESVINIYSISGKSISSTSVIENGLAAISFHDELAPGLYVVVIEEAGSTLSRLFVVDQRMK